MFFWPVSEVPLRRWRPSLSEGLSQKQPWYSHSVVTPGAVAEALGLAAEAEAEAEAEPEAPAEAEARIEVKPDEAAAMAEEAPEAAAEEAGVGVSAVVVLQVSSGAAVYW